MRLTRCRGVWSACLLTTTCASTEASAALRSSTWAGPGAVVTPSLQCPHAYLSRWYSCSTKCAGTYSSTRVRSSPILRLARPHSAHVRSASGTATWCSCRSAPRVCQPGPVLRGFRSGAGWAWAARLISAASWRVLPRLGLRVDRRRRPLVIQQRLQQERQLRGVEPLRARAPVLPAQRTDQQLQLPILDQHGLQGREEEVPGLVDLPLLQQGPRRLLDLAQRRPRARRRGRPAGPRAGARLSVPRRHGSSAGAPACGALRG